MIITNSKLTEYQNKILKIINNNIKTKRITLHLESKQHFIDIKVASIAYFDLIDSEIIIYKGMKGIKFLILLLHELGHYKDSERLGRRLYKHRIRNNYIALDNFADNFVIDSILDYFEVPLSTLERNWDKLGTFNRLFIHSVYSKTLVVKNEMS